MYMRTQGTGCPRCGREAGRIKTRQPCISVAAPHLLAEWEWEAGWRLGWHPDVMTLGSSREVHWVQQNECKLGLLHRWQAAPPYGGHASPFPSGMAVCACNSLAVQCPEAANLWDFTSNGGLTASDVAVKSRKVVTWKGPDGRQWQQKVQPVVNINRRQHISRLNQQIERVSGV